MQILNISTVIHQLVPVVSGGMMYSVVYPAGVTGDWAEV